MVGVAEEEAVALRLAQSAPVAASCRLCHVTPEEGSGDASALHTITARGRSEQPHLRRSTCVRVTVSVQQNKTFFGTFHIQFASIFTATFIFSNVGKHICRSNLFIRKE